jgi:hypothetical protein
MKEKQISCKYNFCGLMVKATNQNGFESRWCHIMDEASYYNKRQSKGSQMEHTNKNVCTLCLVARHGRELMGSNHHIRNSCH